MKASPKQRRDTKWEFMKNDTCSRTMLHIMNVEHDHELQLEERAVDPLAGGILRSGHQCGLIWGATMGLGAEAFAKEKNCNKACGLALYSAQYMAEAFKNEAGDLDCRFITHTDFSKTTDMAKYMLSGKFLTCFRLADQWAPKALRVARERLTDRNSIPVSGLNCASEVIRLAGGSELHQALVAGWAGGIGLAGKGCGALVAAIWFATQKWLKENPNKSGYNNAYANAIFEEFKASFDGKISCRELIERTFAGVEDHVQHIEDGGCSALISMLVESLRKTGRGQTPGQNR
jgi:hypothetical protein